jgi:hypothetical protein
MTNPSVYFTSIGALFYEENSFGVFLLVSIILGGGAAWLAGRALAETWRPRWQILFYALILGAAVRFIHFALFNGTLLSLHYYLVDSAFCTASAFFGFRVARAKQMATQYHWIYAPDGPLGWHRKQD